MSCILHGDVNSNLSACCQAIKITEHSKTHAIELPAMGRVSVEDGPTRPLIDGSGSRSSHRTTPGSAVNHDSEVVDVVSHDEDYVESQRPTLFVWMLTVAAGLSGLLFGYEWVCKSHLRALACTDAMS